MMAAISILVVADGPWPLTPPTPPEPLYDGFSFAKLNMIDTTFTISEFLYLLANDTSIPISIDTAHRRNDPNAKYPNFNFKTTIPDLSVYDVIWLFGYEGFNGSAPGLPNGPHFPIDYESAIGPAEVSAILEFMDSGGGLFATGDHAGLGSYMCGQIPRVCSMRKWFGQQSDLTTNAAFGYPQTVRDYANNVVTALNWEGGGADRIDTLQKNTTVHTGAEAQFNDTDAQFFFDDQSDNLPMTLSFPQPSAVHPILQGRNGPLTQFPDHMHEGEAVTPAYLNATINLPGGPQNYKEYPDNGNGYQPAPGIIATASTVSGHSTEVPDTGQTGYNQAHCEQFFTGDTQPTNPHTIGVLCAYDGRGVGVGRIVTDSSFHHYLDLNLIGDPCGCTVDRQTGFGTGFQVPAAGSILANLQDVLVNTAVWLARPDRNFYFLVDKSSFGLDEASNGSTFPAFTNAFWLVVAGHSLTEVQNSLGSLKLGGAFTAIPGLAPLTPVPAGSLVQDSESLIRIPFTVQFSSASMASFPPASPPGQTTELLLTATLSIGGQSYLAETTLELVAGADPYFMNVNPSANNVFYLSQDLNIFTVTPGADNSLVSIGGTPVVFQTADPTTRNDSDAQNYIVNLLKAMNADTTLVNLAPQGDPFAGFPSQYVASGDSSVTPTSSGPGNQTFVNYNFAVARVRLIEPASATPPTVKTFFRLFITQTSDTDYDPPTSYASLMDASNLPSEPLPAPDGETVPFFAGGSSAIDYAPGGPNNRTISVGSGGTSAYFGCYLNVYDPSINLKQFGTHHCIVAQIAYDGAPIVNANGVTVGPENCAQLAQRNIQVTFSGNPGSAGSRTIPQTFDVRSGPAVQTSAGQLLDFPDELMIDWGNAPAGTVANIYWPQVQCIDVVRMAARRYGTRELSLSDEHTLQCVANGGVSYVPIPSGVGERIASLLTVVLPPGVVKGQEFNIVVRRISSRQLGSDVIAAAPRAVARQPVTVQRNWRYVVGTFQVKIPVIAEHDLRLPEENTYAILLWRFNQLSPGNRWWPVMKRYLDQIAARIRAAGGDPSTILPSPTGVGPKGKGGGVPPFPGGAEHEGLTGKIVAVLYDRFGDFDGFQLKTEKGHEHTFRAVEPEIEELVRFAWAERVTVTVYVHPTHRGCPTSIALRRMPGEGVHH
jgi:hypothetical protein